MSDEQVIESLRNKGKDDPESIKLLERWAKELESGLDVVYESEGNESFAIAGVRCAMRRAIVYYKAGYVGEAIADLTETKDAAGSEIFRNSGLYEQASVLLDKMKTGKTVESS